MTGKKRRAVVTDFEAVINKHGLERPSNTADWILARYLVASLCLWDALSDGPTDGVESRRPPLPPRRAKRRTGRQ